MPRCVPRPPFPLREPQDERPRPAGVAGIWVRCSGDRLGLQATGRQLGCRGIPSPPFPLREPQDERPRLAGVAGFGSGVRATGWDFSQTGGSWDAAAHPHPAFPLRFPSGRTAPGKCQDVRQGSIIREDGRGQGCADFHLRGMGNVHETCTVPGATGTPPPVPPSRPSGRTAPARGVRAIWVRCSGERLGLQPNGLRAGFCGIPIPLVPPSRPSGRTAPGQGCMGIVLQVCAACE